MSAKTNHRTSEYSWQLVVASYLKALLFRKRRSDPDPDPDPDPDSDSDLDLDPDTKVSTHLRDAASGEPNGDGSADSLGVMPKEESKRGPRPQRVFRSIETESRAYKFLREKFPNTAAAGKKHFRKVVATLPELATDRHQLTRASDIRQKRESRLAAYAQNLTVEFDPALFDILSDLAGYRKPHLIRVAMDHALLLRPDDYTAFCVFLDATGKWLVREMRKNRDKYADVLAQMQPRNGEDA